MALFNTLVGFVASTLISTIIIYVATKIFKEKEDYGLGTALIAAIVGAVIYSAAYHILGIGLVAAMIGGFFWLVTIGALYDVGWGKAFVIAVVIWLAATFIGVVLPTLRGPL